MKRDFLMTSSAAYMLFPSSVLSGCDVKDDVDEEVVDDFLDCNCVTLL